MTPMPLPARLLAKEEIDILDGTCQPRSRVVTRHDIAHDVTALLTRGLTTTSAGGFFFIPYLLQLGAHDLAATLGPPKHEGLPKERLALGLVFESIFGLHCRYPDCRYGQPRRLRPPRWPPLSPVALHPVPFPPSRPRPGRPGVPDHTGEASRRMRPGHARPPRQHRWSPHEDLRSQGDATLLHHAGRPLWQSDPHLLHPGPGVKETPDCSGCLLRHHRLPGHPPVGGPDTRQVVAQTPRGV